MKHDNFTIPTNPFPIGWSIQPMPCKPGEKSTWAATYKTVTQTGFTSAESAYKYLCNQMSQVIAALEDEIAEISGEQPFDPDNCAIPAMHNFWQEKISKGATNGKAD